MSYRQLSQEELSTIADLQVGHTSGARIARMLGRSRSTIYRELARNRKPSDLRYRAEPAYSYATARRRRLRAASTLPPSIGPARIVHGEP
jgi:IS30 family transposase